MVDFTKSWDEIVEVNDGVPFEKSEQEVDTKKFFHDDISMTAAAHTYTTT